MRTSTLRARVLGNRKEPQENVIPMINIIFLLLLYFMIAGNLQPDYELVPPDSSSDSEPPKQLVVVTISADGQMTLDGRTVTKESLPQALSRIVGHERLKIYADGKTQALMISEVMKASANAGIHQFVLVTKTKRADG
ncbi:MAG: biopolymer transporter ExbD [Pseudomonadota bacterium]